MQKKRILVLVICLILITVTSFFIGRFPNTNIKEMIVSDSLMRQLMLQIRIPRVLTALLVGSGLAVAGLITQTIFRNPLADGSLLGISQAAGFGAALGILIFQGNQIYIQIIAFVFGMAALILSVWISEKVRSDKILPLILAGISISALFSAGLGLTKYMADPINQLPSIVYWLLGSLANSTWPVLVRTSIIIIPVLVILWLYRWRLNLYALDEEVGFSFGLKNKHELWAILLASVLLTSSIISISGLVGWVGLIVPNYARIISGSDMARSLPITFLLGAIFMIICDNLARASLPGEIPLGILTAFLGSIFFVGLLVKKENFA